MKRYYYAGGERIAMRSGTTLYYLFGDHLGSTSVVANSTGSLHSRQLYKAWGENRWNTGTVPTTFRYTGQRQEAGLGGASGLYDYGARFYDPALGRFMQADTDVPESQGVQGLDRYAYVNNSPLRYSDPSGHSWFDTVGQFATGFVYEFARTTAWYSPQAQDVLRVNAAESDAMLAGRITADVASIIIGFAGVAGGITIGTAGTAVSCAATLCTTAVVTVGVGVVTVGASATTALAGAAGLGGNLAQLTGNGGSSSSNSGSINFNPRTLQHEYSSHAADFGITGNWNRQNSQAFQQAILNHISGKDTQVLQGTYRGNISGTHYYNPNNNLWVFVDSNGNYRAGWKLSQEQLNYLLSNGNIQ